MQGFKIITFPFHYKLFIPNSIILQLAIPGGSWFIPCTAVDSGNRVIRNSSKGRCFLTFLPDVGENKLVTEILIKSIEFLPELFISKKTISKLLEK